MGFPQTLPETHQKLLSTIIQTLSEDSRICGIGAGGSYVSDSMDRYSDLDLVIAVYPDAFHEVMKERLQILDRIGGRIAAFTGEHVGEPRLIIALFGPDAVHVDFKFVALPDAALRVDDTQVLWERKNLLSHVFEQNGHHYPQPDPQWIEDRFWIWVHYAATKIARGEYFETLEFISFLRQNVLSPLALMQNGLTPSGVRKIEMRLPAFAEKLCQTVAVPEKAALIRAVDQCIHLYLLLRENTDVSVNHEAQNFCIAYFSNELK